MAHMGGDVEQLHELGNHLNLKQGDIDAIINAVTTALGNTMWDGPARQRFQSEWEGSFRQALNGMKEAFAAAGNECKSRATALHAAMAV